MEAQSPGDLLICTSMQLMHENSPAVSGEMWRTEEWPLFIITIIIIFVLFFFNLQLDLWFCAILYHIYSVYILTIPQTTTSEFKQV